VQRLQSISLQLRLRSQLERHLQLAAVNQLHERQLEAAQLVVRHSHRCPVRSVGRSCRQAVVAVCLHCCRRL
jgi:hypothetical protein